MKFNELKNMLISFGDIVFTEEIRIRRADMISDSYPKGIVYSNIPGSFSDRHIFNFPEWIKIHTLEALEDMLREQFKLDKIRPATNCFWTYKKIKPKEGRYEEYGLGESCILENIPAYDKDKLNIEIINARLCVDYYRFTVKYKGKKKVYFVPRDGVYNKELREVFPI
jgi:hypothetical protein|nr:MAG TPA: hypothetical protein [Caudoviricetes sp.]